jgi:hypothetical protein
VQLRSLDSTQTDQPRLFPRMQRSMGLHGRKLPYQRSGLSPHSRRREARKRVAARCPTALCHRSLSRSFMTALCDRSSSPLFVTALRHRSFVTALRHRSSSPLFVTALRHRSLSPPADRKPIPAPQSTHVSLARRAETMCDSPSCRRQRIQAVYRGNQTHLATRQPGIADNSNRGGPWTVVPFPVPVPRIRGSAYARSS